MGQRIAKLLHSARQNANRYLKEIEAETGIKSGLLSNYENNKKTPGFGKLAALTRGYGLAFAQVVRCWMEDALENEKDRNTLLVEVLGNPGSAPTSPFPVMLDSLRPSRDVHRAAEKVLNHFEKSKELLDASTHAILEALVRIPSLRVVGEKDPRYYPNPTLQWVSVRPESKWQKQVLFVAKRPTPVLAELHQVPPRTGGIHCQVDSRSCPAYYELWSTVQGKGVLLVEREAQAGRWDEFDAGVGACGGYFGGHRHIWLNLRHDEPLILFHLFFPYRSMAQMDQAIEFELSHLGGKVPDELRATIEAAVANRDSTV